METKFDQVNQIFFREGTLDHSIFEHVCIKDEYGLKKEHFSSEDIALDIGGHIGCFALAALMRGIGYVRLYEASPQNVVLCHKNLEEFRDRVSIENLAVWSEANLTLLIDEFPNWGTAVNTGGGDLFGTKGVAVRTIGFDQIIRELTQDFSKRLRILKIDSEGSEWPILLTSQTLRHIDIIVGELHEFGGQYDELSTINIAVPGYSRYTRREFARFMDSQNFDIAMDNQHKSRYILFKAINRKYSANDTA